jgi:diacylglycerol kinase (ATP)
LDLEPVLDRRGDRPLVVAGGDGSLHTTVRALWRRGEADTCPSA